MLDIEIAQQGLSALKIKMDLAAKTLNLDAIKEEIAELHAEMDSPNFWLNVERSTVVNKRVSVLENKLKHVLSLYQDFDNIEALLLLLSETSDVELEQECASELEKLSTNVEELSLETLLRGEYDASDAILSLHAGAGGTEAQDWCSMLFRMYTRFCERSGFRLKILDYLDGDEAGIKSVTFQVSGQNVYGFLRSEKGVHRLVRISPFDTNAKRHTSFTSLDVSPMIESSDFQLNMEEVRIDTYRASGAGGQHVNKTESAVRMTHIPTGIVVQCQNERSQMLNKEVCMNMLKSRLIELQEREKEEKMAEIKGEMKKIEWGSQIRSYVFQPYTMVKDHRTGYETANIADVMDGKIEGFIHAYLRMQ